MAKSKRGKGRSPQKRKKRTHIFKRERHDWYVEEEEVSAAFFKAEWFNGKIHDPCAGFGRVARAAADVYGNLCVSACDISYRPRSKLHVFPVIRGKDFYREAARAALGDRPLFVNIASNPPYRECYSRADFKMLRAMFAVTKRKVALLMPYGFQYGTDNADFIAEAKRKRWGLARIYNVVPRPSMPPGSYLLKGKKPGGGRVDFSWFVFWRGYRGPCITQWLRT